jgi:hypothetical protein
MVTRHCNYMCAAALVHQDSMLQSSRTLHLWFDCVLGDVWLEQHSAVLDYAAQSVHVRAATRVHVIHRGVSFLLQSQRASCLQYVATYRDRDSHVSWL